MRPVRVTGADDPRVAAYRDIRERDLVGREGGFIAEGEVVLRVLATQSAHACVSVLIDERRLAKLTPILEALPADTPVYLADREVVDGIAGFPLHRGILAIGRRAAAPSVDELLANAPERAVVLALFGISNHDNMGGLFRNAAAFGAHAVLLGPDCCDPLYRKAIRVSVGAALRVPFAYLGESDDPITTLAAHGFESLALSPAGANTLAELKPGGRTAVLMGAEGPGLSHPLLARCRTVQIPMAASWDSLNVATTSGIVLHHLATTQLS